MAIKFATADEMQAYRAKNFFDYKPEFDIELKKMRAQEEAAKRRELAVSLFGIQERAIKQAKDLRTQRNKQARAAANKEIMNKRQSKSK